MLESINIFIYILIFAVGFFIHKFFFANRGSTGWTNKEFDSTITLVGLFVLVGIMLFLFQNDLKEDASLVMISLLGYVGLAVKDAFPSNGGNEDAGNEDGENKD